MPPTLPKLNQSGTNDWADVEDNDVALRDYFGSIVNADISAAAAIANTKLDHTWTSFTPTWSNVTMGNATNTGRYVQLNKLVIATVSLTLGSTSAITGSPVFNAPVTRATAVTETAAVHLVDDSAASTYIASAIPIAQSFSIRVHSASSSFVQRAAIDASTPFVWTTSDSIRATAVYEAA